MKGARTQSAEIFVRIYTTLPFSHYLARPYIIFFRLHGLTSFWRLTWATGINLLELSVAGCGCSQQQSCQIRLFSLTRPSQLDQIANLGRVGLAHVFFCCMFFSLSPVQSKTHWFRPSLVRIIYKEKSLKVLKQCIKCQSSQAQRVNRTGPTWHVHLVPMIKEPNPIKNIGPMGQPIRPKSTLQPAVNRRNLRCDYFYKPSSASHILLNKLTSIPCILLVFSKE